MPVSRSADSSTTAAEYEYVGVGPTPAPFHFATDFGGVYEPTAPSVPNSPSASTTASTNVSDFDASAASQMRRPPARSRSTGTSSFFAAASKIGARTRRAAWMAALPVISVTRDE